MFKVHAAHVPFTIPRSCQILHAFGGPGIAWKKNSDLASIGEPNHPHI